MVDILRHIAPGISGLKATTQATIIDAIGAAPGVPPRSGSRLLPVGASRGGGEYRLRLVLR